MRILRAVELGSEWVSHTQLPLYSKIWCEVTKKGLEREICSFKARQGDKFN